MFCLLGFWQRWKWNTITQVRGNYLVFRYLGKVKMFLRLILLLSTSEIWIKTLSTRAWNRTMLQIRLATHNDWGPHAQLQHFPLDFPSIFSFSFSFFGQEISVQFSNSLFWTNSFWCTKKFLGWILYFFN